MTNNFSLDFRPLIEKDLPLLFDWLNRPHLKEWWDGKQSLDDVRNNYLPKIHSADAAHPFIVCLDGTPAGYIQYYHVAEEKHDWWPDAPGPGVLGIDQFLADEKSLNQGIGTAMISQFVDFLLKDAQIREIRVDPHPENKRAIHCYLKVGFRKLGLITTPDGPAEMMILRRGQLK